MAAKFVSNTSKKKSSILVENNEKKSLKQKNLTKYIFGETLLSINQAISSTNLGK